MLSTTDFANVSAPDTGPDEKKREKIVPRHHPPPRKLRRCPRTAREHAGNAGPPQPDFKGKSLLYNSPLKTAESPRGSRGEFGIAAVESRNLLRGAGMRNVAE